MFIFRDARVFYENQICASATLALAVAQCEFGYRSCNPLGTLRVSVRSRRGAMQKLPRHAELC